MTLDFWALVAAGIVLLLVYEGALAYNTGKLDADLPKYIMLIVLGALRGEWRAKHQESKPPDEPTP